MISFLTLSDIVNNIISICVAVALLYIGDRVSTRSRLSVGKEPQDEATCAVHILKALKERRDDDTKTYPPKWEQLYKDATELINDVTEGGNYSDKLPRRPRKPHSHSCHMHQARDKLEDGKLVEVVDNKSSITDLGSRLLERTGQYKSKDERDAVFEDFYLHGIFSPPPGEDRDRDHHVFLDGLLPEGRKGQVAFRADCESGILLLLRFKSVASSEHNGRLPAIEWISVEFDAKSELDTSHLLQNDIDYSKAAEIFELTPTRDGVEHRLKHVRNKVDMAWLPNELLAKDFDDIHKPPLYTLVRWLADRATTAAIDHVTSGWLGRFGEFPNDDALKDTLDRVGGPTSGDMSSDSRGQTLLPVGSKDLECVAWAALIPQAYSSQVEKS